MVFISFEGPDGSGKTTQIALLTQRLIADGRSVVATREPGGTAIGALIRNLLLDSEHTVSATTEAYLMTADRAEHTSRVILPALDRGDIVISDRYFDSTLAYQGGGRGLDIDDLREMQKLATGGLQPALTLLLDLPVETGLERKLDDHPGNRMDHESLAFHQRVSDAYRALARSEPSRWQVIDATSTVEMVHTAVWDQVAARLDAHRAALKRGHIA